MNVNAKDLAPLFDALAESLENCAAHVRSIYSTLMLDEPVIVQEAPAEPAPEPAPAPAAVTPAPTPAAAPDPAAPVPQVTLEQFSAKVTDLVMTTGGRQGALAGPNPQTGVSIIQEMLARYAPNGGGLGEIAPEQYVNFVKELQQHAAVAGVPQ
jgi:hypothetical protein